LLKDIETGARGFALTENRAYIEPALAKPKLKKKYFAFAELD
jgi:CHASE3 domain sensor protein